MIASGAAERGMIPKLEACITAVEGGRAARASDRRAAAARPADRNLYQRGHRHNGPRLTSEYYQPTMQYGNNQNNTDVLFNHQLNRQRFTHRLTRFSALLGIVFALLSPGLQSSSRGDIPFQAHAENPSTPISAHRLPDNYKTSLTNLLHWTHFPLRVAFVNGMTIGSHDLDTVVRSGFDEWVSATQGAVCYEVISNATHADVTVTYDVVPSRPFSGERLGATGFSFNPARKQLKRATMHLNVWDGMTRHDLARFQNTAAHEFGHALGINGHSPIPGDLMYYSSASAQGVTERDVNTLRLAYGQLARTAERTADTKTKQM